MRRSPARLRDIGAGWMQVISDFDDVDDEFAMLRRLVATSRRPMAITILQRDNKPEEWRRLAGWIAEANAAGLPMFGQVLTRPTGILLGFEISQNPFVEPPKLSEDRVAAVRPAHRAPAPARLPRDGCWPRRATARAWSAAWRNGIASSRLAIRRITSLRPMRRLRPWQCGNAAIRPKLPYDLLLERGGKAILYRPLSNYSYGNLDTVHDMLTHDATIVGLGDGGAHVGVLCDSSAISYMLTHWTRDRTRGAKLPLPWAIKRLTHDSAAAIGLGDRGVVAPGYKADINVIDYDRLQLRQPEVVYDLPSGGRRLVQRTDGYVATIVSGVPVYRDGESTGALPGRLVRGTSL